MYQTASEPARWATVLHFQQISRKYDTNSFEFEVADHAATLALNSSRPVDAYFARNAFRDAKSIVQRLAVGKRPASFRSTGSAPERAMNLL